MAASFTHITISSISYPMVSPLPVGFNARYHADALGGHKELVETLLAARCDAMQGDGGATQMGELWTSWPLNRWEMMG